MTRMAVFLLLLAGLCPAGAHAAGSMRCNGRIVGDGDRVAELLGACGEPAYRDAWHEPGRSTHVITVDTQEWYYNFGPNQLLRVVRVRGGRIADIGSDGYGYDQPPQPPCNSADIVPGMTKFRLLLKCGAPVTSESRSVLRRLDVDDPYDQYDLHRNQNSVTSVYREEWVYNFGADALLRVVTLENGRVTDVQNGDRGFD